MMFVIRSPTNDMDGFGSNVMLAADPFGNCISMENVLRPVVLAGAGTPCGAAATTKSS